MGALPGLLFYLRHDGAGGFLHPERLSAGDGISTAAAAGAVAGRAGREAPVCWTRWAWLRAEWILLLVTFFQLLAGFLLLRQEYALLLAVVIALIDALPVFGTGTVLLPWAAVLCVAGNVPRGTLLAALYAVIAVVRSVPEPKIVAAQVGLPPLVALGGHVSWGSRRGRGGDDPACRWRC